MTSFPPFDDWRTSDTATALLKAAYAAMAVNASHYSHEPWRHKKPAEHVAKATTHLLAVQHHGPDYLDDKPSPSMTGLPHICSVAARLSYALALMAKEAKYDWLAVKEGPIIDTTELERAE